MVLNVALIYLDSCIVIYLIEGSQEVRKRIQQQLSITCQDMHQACVSALTRMECRVLPLRRHDGEILAKFELFFNESGVCFLPINNQVFDLATELRANRNLRTGDALHMATAVIGGCGEFWTNDNRLARATDDRMRIVLPIEGMEHG